MLNRFEARDCLFGPEFFGCSRDCPMFFGEIFGRENLIRLDLA
jgi:hypothetical protein